MTDTALTTRDLDIMQAIDEIRAEHHACTAAAVAVRLHLSKPYVHELMHNMYERGIVTWSAEMPGSVRVLVDRNGVRLKKPADRVVNRQSTPVQPGSAA